MPSMRDVIIQEHPEVGVCGPSGHTITHIRWHVNACSDTPER